MFRGDRLWFWLIEIGDGEDGEEVVGPYGLSERIKLYKGSGFSLCSVFNSSSSPRHLKSKKQTLLVQFDIKSAYPSFFKMKSSTAFALATALSGITCTFAQTDRGNETIPGLGERKQEVLDAGANTLDLAIAMLET